MYLLWGGSVLLRALRHFLRRWWGSRLNKPYGRLTASTFFCQLLKHVLTVRGLGFWRMLEWWWETTNTFHMPWGEITITPLDFAMLTKLSFKGREVEVDWSLTWSHLMVLTFLGLVVRGFPDNNRFIEYTWLHWGWLFKVLWTSGRSVFFTYWWLVGILLVKKLAAYTCDTFILWETYAPSLNTAKVAWPSSTSCLRWRRLFACLSMTWFRLAGSGVF